MKKTAIIAAILFPLMSLSLAAQTKGEVSMYEKTIKKPSVRSAERFLKKYPSSGLAPKVVRLRDSILFFSLNPEDAKGVLQFVEKYPSSPFSEEAGERILLHNTSRISRDDALALAGDCIDAVGWKKDNVEHVIALDKDFSVRILSPEGALQSSGSIPHYSLSGAPIPGKLVLPMEIVRPLGNRNYIHFGYRGAEGEYVEVLYLPEEDIVHQALFYGSPLQDGRIEGESPEEIGDIERTAEVGWILGRFSENPSLVHISRADLLTDSSIQWWLEKNGRGSSRLSFGTLDPESSLVAAYQKASKEKGKSYNAAFFTIRGYTVIVAASRRSGEYLLIWCEKAPQNRRRDKFLNTIYFENDGTTLNLFFYKGSSTSKTRISLASGKVSG